MLVAKFSVEAPGYFILVAILFSVVGYMVTTNAAANWLSKRLQAWTKERKLKQAVSSGPVLCRSSSEPIHVLIESVVRKWLISIDPAYQTQPSAIVGTPTSAIINIGIFDQMTTDTMVLPALAGSWYCEIASYIFIDSNLLDLVRAFDGVIPVEHIHCSDRQAGGIMLFFKRTATDEQPV